MHIVCIMSPRRCVNRITISCHGSRLVVILSTVYLGLLYQYNIIVPGFTQLTRHHTNCCSNTIWIYNVYIHILSDIHIILHSDLVCILNFCVDLISILTLFTVWSVWLCSTLEEKMTVISINTSLGSISSKTCQER